MNSVIDKNVRFMSQPTMAEILQFRKANMKITEMLWINKRLSIDYDGEIYNPKALIMIILN